MSGYILDFFLNKFIIKEKIELVGEYKIFMQKMLLSNNY